MGYPQRHKQGRHWSPVTLVLGVLAAALLTLMLIANQRQRRELQRLASPDAHARLPKRHGAAELARTARARPRASKTLRRSGGDVPSVNEIIASADRAICEANKGGRNFWHLDRETYRTATSRVLKWLNGGA
jgi:hypothetical protein